MVMVGGGIIMFAREARAKFFETTPTLGVNHALFA